jgi:AcrR family transcriptional regulator
MIRKNGEYQDNNMQTTLRKKPNKEKIMEAALQVFAEKGFQETTISEISKKAGVADATIYEYFEGKEDLLFSISETITQRANDLTNEILPFTRDPESKVPSEVWGQVSTFNKVRFWMIFL